MSTGVIPKAFVAALALGWFSALGPGTARAEAPTKADCSAADTNAQSLLRTGKFARARLELHRCIDVSCPTLVQRDCTERLDALDRLEPSIVFAAISSRGEDLANVRATVDGELFAQRLDGREVACDPGEHEFVFQAGGAGPVVKHYVVREGEKARHETVIIPLDEKTTVPRDSAAAPLEPTVQLTSSSVASEQHTLRAATLNGWRSAAFAVGAIGIASGLVGGGFGVATALEYQAQKADCSPSACPNRDRAAAEHKNVQTWGATSTVTMIAGGALAAVGGAILILAPGRKRAASQSFVRVEPTLGAQALGVEVVGAFE